MFRTDTGGPAFPRPGFYPDTTDGCVRDYGPTITEPTAGMTLFDYYVGQALAGILANSGTFGRALPPLDRAEAQQKVDELGGAAVVYAHAAMEARAAYLALPRKPRPHNPDEDDS